ncbi:MAG: hypothetical protein IPK19_04985 [Chloroflexi bacterium]|nr:hypothetical protein [Chloroflexota bacterium]
MSSSSPPQPPQIARRLEFYPVQVIGLLLIIVIPVLALLGVFGASYAHEQRASADLEIEIDYASRLRYKTLENLHVSVRNLTNQTVSILTLRFGGSYIDQFSSVVFTPSVEQIADGYYEVLLSDIRPGETRTVTVEIKGERYGLHQGIVAAAADGLEGIEVDIATLTFP